MRMSSVAELLFTLKGGGNGERLESRSQRARASREQKERERALWALAKEPQLCREVQRSLWKLEFISAPTQRRKDILKGFAVAETLGKPLVSEDDVLAMTAWLPPEEKFALRAYYYETGADLLKSQAQSELLGSSPFGFVVGFGEGILDAVVGLGKTIYGTGKSLGHLLAFDPSGAWRTLQETYGPIGEGLANLFSGRTFRELYRLAQEDPLAFNRALGNLGGEVFVACAVGSQVEGELKNLVNLGRIGSFTERSYFFLSLLQDWFVNFPAGLEHKR